MMQTLNIAKSKNSVASLISMTSTTKSLDFNSMWQYKPAYSMFGQISQQCRNSAWKRILAMRGGGTFEIGPMKSPALGNSGGLISDNWQQHRE